MTNTNQPKATGAAGKTEALQQPKALENMGREEQVGFHKGALSTLVKERQEMVKILQIVEQLMQMHVASLKELGVDLEAMAKEQIKQAQHADPKNPAGKPEKPIEDLLK
ncbi:hypothetical protein COY95_03110 [Candidatus Woesearchaeota archaeon CG_4_10_14_0_8_um_filter_47_5]|nr:MAG: hypothetical protein COY95_03110 [Candidatus Woesearchaeota archaeon CG_4_10_14_0_8_um_filter_47_5]